MVRPNKNRITKNTSISIYIDQFNWVKDTNFKLGEFVRVKLDELNRNSNVVSSVDILAEKKELDEKLKVTLEKESVQVSLEKELATIYNVISVHGPTSIHTRDICDYYAKKLGVEASKLRDLAVERFQVNT